MRNAILSAIVGAALALGVGGSLPVWELPGFLFPFSLVASGYGSPPPTGTLWRVIDERARQIAEVQRAGVSVSVSAYVDGLVLPTLSLLAVGAVSGVVVWVVWRAVRRPTRG
jgi:hypothetical protein